jgi:hypothetical protein
MMKLWIVGGVLTWWAQLHAQPAPKPAAPATCMAADAEPVLIAIDANKLRQCAWDGAHLSCFATELATGAWSSAAAPAGSERPRIAPIAGAPKIDVGDQRATVCHADGSACKTLTPKSPVDPGLGLSAAANAAGTLGALGYYGDKTWVETFDLATGKRIARVAAGSKKVKCVTVDVLGDALYVDEAVCGGEVSTAWLGSKAGKRIAAVGGAQPIHPSGQAVHLADTLWAFSAAAGDTVVLQDVKTGKVTKRIAIGPAVETASAALVGDARRLVLVFGGSRAGDVAVVDLASDKVTSYPGKRCGH